MTALVTIHWSNTTDALVHPLSSRRRTAAVLILVFVLALHWIAWWVFNVQSPVARELAASIPVRVSVRWLPPPKTAPPEMKPALATPEPHMTRPPPAPRRPRASVAPAAARPSPAVTPTQEAIHAPATPPLAAPLSAALPAQAAASSAGPPRPSILDSPATRQAIVDAARAPSLADLPGTTRRAGLTQQLGSAIASGAHGDCDKGEFVGGGMGLLSLPFWAVAKLNGACGR